MGSQKNRLNVDPDQTATKHRTYGIANAYDTICFQTKCDYFEEYCSEKDNFLKYFQDRLHNDICDKLNLPVRQNKITFVCFVWFDHLRLFNNLSVKQGQEITSDWTNDNAVHE